MKKKYFLLLVFLIGPAAVAQTIEIPDPLFKQHLIAGDYHTQDADSNNIQIDTNNDGEVQQSEALLVSRLFIGDEVASAVGIQYFTNVRDLILNTNFMMSTLDISTLTALEKFYCTNTMLTSLNFSGANLEELFLASNQLHSLDIASLATNTHLTVLDLSFNELDAIDLSPLATNNHISSIILSYNNLTILDLSALNSTITDLDLRNNQLSDLDFSSFTHHFNTIDISENNFTSVDFSGLTSGTSLFCNNNLNLTYVKIPADFAPNMLLLSFDNPNLETIDVRNNSFDGCYLIANPCQYPGWIIGNASPTICVDDIVVGEYPNGDPKTEKSYFEDYYSEISIPAPTVSTTCALSDVTFAAQNTIALYPNPAENRLNITGQVEMKSVSVYNVLGQLMGQQNTAGKEKTSLDISSLQSGTYFVTIESDGGLSTQRFLKR
jgi:hypothetical protein